MTVVGAAYIEVSPVTSDFADDLEAKVAAPVKEVTAQARASFVELADNIQVTMAAAFDQIEAYLEDRLGAPTKVATDEAAGSFESMSSRMHTSVSVALDGVAEGMQTKLVAPTVEATDQSKAAIESWADSVMRTVTPAMDEARDSIVENMGQATAAVDLYKDKAVAAVEEVATATKITNDSVKASNDETGLSRIFDSGTTSAGNLFTKLGNLTSSIPLVGESFKKMGENFSEAESNGGKFVSILQSVGKLSFVAGGALAVGIGAESVNLALSQQSAAAKLAATAGISVKAANQIGDALVGTAFKSIYTGTQMTVAYSGVAAQLASTQGSALNAKQALGFMTGSADLAEASGVSLTGATSTLAATLQAYGLKAGEAASASSALFVASTITGVSVTSLGSSVDKMKSKLGAVAPSLQDTTALIVDMTEHGETGRASITAVTGAFTTFLKPAAAAATATANLNLATKALPTSLQLLASQYSKGLLTSAQVTAATKGMSTTQANLFANFVSASKAATVAASAQAKLGIATVDASGKMLPMSTIIAELHKQTLGMTTAQATAKLEADGFGTSSAKLVAIVQAGPAAFSAATKAVSNTTAAHEAAEKQSQTLAHQVELLKSGLEDEGVKIGTLLIPYIKDLVKWTGQAVDWMMKHKGVMEALAITVGTVLVTAMAAFVAGAVVDAATFILAWAPVVLPIAAIAVAVYELYTHWTTVWDFIKKYTVEIVAALVLVFFPIFGPIALLGAVALLLAEHWREVLGFLEDTWNTISSVAVTVFNAVLGFFERWWPYILGVFTGGIGLVIGLVIQHWGEIKTETETVWNAITGFFTSTWAAIEAIFNAIITFVVGIFTTTWRVFSTAVQAVWQAILGFITSTWATIQGVFLAIIAFITGLFTATWRVFATVIQAVWQAILGFITTEWQGIQLIFNIIISFVTGVFTGAWTTMRNVVSSVWTDISNDISAGWTLIKAALTVMTDWVSGTFTKVWTSLTGAIAGVWTAVQAGASSAWGLILGVIRPPVNTIIGGINFLINGVDSITGAVGGPHIGDITKMATGGFITDGPYLVGEGNRKYPEFVLATDPAYRGRNRELWLRAAHELGIPGFATGGGPDTGLGGLAGAGDPTFQFGSNFSPGTVVKAVESAGSFVVNTAGTIAGDATSIVSSILKYGAKEVLKGIFAAVNAMIGGVGIGFLKNLIEGPSGLEGEILSWVAGPVTAKATKQQAAALAAAAPGTSAQVLAWIASAEAATGVSGANWTAGLADIIAHESAGNPNAINNWDINAKEGHPSQGLMQTIPSTFARWAVPGLGGILNPVANIAAGINYIIDRYGSIGNVPGIRSQAAGGPYVGYRMGGILGLPVNLFDDGGMLPQGWSVAGNFTGRSEPVTPAGGPGFGVPFSPNITVIGGGDAQKTAAIVEGRVRHAWVDMMHGAGRY